jgi:hypothetical protein
MIPYDPVRADEISDLEVHGLRGAVLGLGVLLQLLVGLLDHLRGDVVQARGELAAAVGIDDARLLRWLHVHERGGRGIEGWNEAGAELVLRRHVGLRAAGSEQQQHSSNDQTLHGFPQLIGVVNMPLPRRVQFSQNRDAHGARCAAVSDPTISRAPRPNVT